MPLRTLNSFSYMAGANSIRFTVSVGSLRYLSDLRVRDRTQHFKRRLARKLRENAHGVLARQQDVQRVQCGVELMCHVVKTARVFWSCAIAPNVMDFASGSKHPSLVIH
jgi:hypothetical protein